MKKALVTVAGKICEVRANTFPVHPDLAWVDVPDDTIAGFDTWDGAQVVKWVPPSPIDISNIDNLSRIMKALGLLVAQYAGKTPAQVKADFKTIFDSLGG